MNATNTTVIDPVCGMTIDPAHAAATSEYDGQTIHFCAVSCKTTFDAAPEDFLEPAATSCCSPGGSCCAK